jgi:hypothetical protein
LGVFNIVLFEIFWVTNGKIIPKIKEINFFECFFFEIFEFFAQNISNPTKLMLKTPKHFCELQVAQKNSKKFGATMLGGSVA